MSEEKLSHDAKWQLKNIREATAKLETEIVRLETALDDSSGVVQPLLEYSRALYNFYLSDYESPGTARARASKVFAENQSIREQNSAIIEQNSRVLLRLTQVVKNAGVAESVRISKPGSRGKTIWVDCDWKQALRAAAPVCDAGWSRAESEYKHALSVCDRVQKEREEQERKRTAAEEQRRKNVAAEALRCELVVKWSLDPALTLRGLLDALLEKNKYLSLAYWLERNRGDWNDGPNFAELGLSRFKAETDEDREIESELWGHVNDWDGDGRIFRDCRWNYDALYKKVQDEAPDLIADYIRVRDLSDYGEGR